MWLKIDQFFALNVKKSADLINISYLARYLNIQQYFPRSFARMGNEARLEHISP